MSVGAVPNVLAAELPDGVGEVGVEVVLVVVVVLLPPELVGVGDPVVAGRLG